MLIKALVLVVFLASVSLLTVGVLRLSSHPDPTHATKTPANAEVQSFK